MYVPPVIGPVPIPPSPPAQRRIDWEREYDRQERPLRCPGVAPMAWRGYEQMKASPVGIMQHRQPLKPMASGPPAPPLTPYAWWDAEVGAYQDLAKTTPAVANNDPVAALNDQVGTKHIVNSGGTDRPLLKTNSANGHPALQFDAANDLLRATFTFGAVPLALFMCVRIDTWTQWMYIVGPVGAGASSIYMHTASPKIQSYGSGAGGDNADMTVGQYAIVAIMDQTTFNTLRVNAGSTVLLGGSGCTFAGICWAAYGGATPQSWAAVSIARMAIYNTALTVSDETTIRNDFNTRYACF